MALLTLCCLQSLTTAPKYYRMALAFAYIPAAIARPRSDGQGFTASGKSGNSGPSHTSTLYKHNHVTMHYSLQSCCHSSDRARMHQRYSTEFLLVVREFYVFVARIGRATERRRSTAPTPWLLSDGICRIALAVSRLCRICAFLMSSRCVPTPWTPA